jgi:hypothetical protein
MAPSLFILGPQGTISYLSAMAVGLSCLERARLGRISCEVSRNRAGVRGYVEDRWVIVRVCGPRWKSRLLRR